MAPQIERSGSALKISSQTSHPNTTTYGLLSVLCVVISRYYTPLSTRATSFRTPERPAPSTTGRAVAGIEPAEDMTGASYRSALRRALADTYQSWSAPDSNRAAAHPRQISLRQDTDWRKDGRGALGLSPVPSFCFYSEPP
jgi:hypothetical protein